MKRRYREPPIKEAACHLQFAAGSPWDMTMPGLIYQEMRDRFPKLQEFGFRGGFSEGQAWELTGELVDYFGAATFTGVR